MMSLDGEIEIEFHPVGHGLFSSIDILLKDYDYNSIMSLVYDCGSMRNESSYLQDSINFYVNLQKKRRYAGKEYIDVLILSHMHYDHVIGVPKLLRRLGAKIILLPYLTPLERLIVALEHPGYLWGWYRDFLINPVLALVGVNSYARKREDWRIIFLTSTREEDHEPERPTFPWEAPSEYPIADAESIRELNVTFNADNLPKDDNAMDTIKREIEFQIEEDYWIEKYGLSKESIRNMVDQSKVDARRARGISSLELGPIQGKYISLWTIIPYVSVVDQSKLTDFRNCIKYVANINNYKEMKLLRNLLRNWNYLRKLKRCYKKIKEDINLTSLSVLGHPSFLRNRYSLTTDVVSPNYLDLFKFFAYFYSDLFPSASLYKLKCIKEILIDSIFIDETELYVIHTGDLPLGNATIWEDFRNYYGEWLKRENMIFQIPHHGSYNGINRDMRRYLAGNIAVVSHSINNFIKILRNPELRRLIYSAGSFMSCNELNEVRINLSFRIH